MTPDEVLQVSGVCSSTSDLFHIHQEMRRLSHESGSQALESLARATGYVRVWTHHEAGFTFQPSTTWENFEYPPALNRLPSGEAALWAEWAGSVDEALLTSRLHHLLWEVQAESAHSHARRAIDAYASLEGTVSDYDFERSQDYGFALDLSLRIGDSDRSTAAVSRIVDWLNQLFGSGQGSPGAIFASLGHLVRLRKRDRPEDLSDLLESAAKRFANDPYLFDDLTDLLIVANQGQGLERQFAVEAVSKWRAAAEAAPSPVLKAAFLNKARDRAQASGLTEERDAILEALMANPMREGMQEISVSTSVSRDDYERWIESFTSHATLPDCIMQFGAYQPTPEDDATAVHFAEEVLAKQPVISLTTRIVTDEFGLPLIVASTHEDHLKVTMAHNDGLSIRLWGLHAADVLDRVLNRWELNGDDEDDLFAGVLVSEEAAKAFRIALAHYRRGDFESAVTLALPRIEECIRTWARHVGVRLLDTSRSGAVQWRSMGSLLQDLEGGAPRRFTRYLNMVLVNQLGLNIRNRVLHGLTASVDKAEAALVLHVAARISLMTVSESE